MKKSLSEMEIRTRYITPALIKSGWDYNDIHEEKNFTDGKIIDEGKGKYKRSKKMRVDYLLTYNSNYMAVIEAKDNNHEVGFGMQQAIEYAKKLDVLFAYSSNGDGFIEKNMITKEEVYIPLDKFPSPKVLWQRYLKIWNLNQTEELIVKEALYPSKHKIRYYQQIAITRTLKAIVKGQNRILLVMATGTGKTFTAFQIIYKLWKSKYKKRILFLADRNILIDQTMINDFAPFKDVMTKINGKYDPAYQIYLGLYQQLKNANNKTNLYEEFPRDFFDLIVIDECHRGSALDDCSWREILDYFDSATKIGLTATPKNEENINTYKYFGEPVYTYTLKQGILDGFLAPYNVIRIILDKDLMGVKKDDETYYDGRLINKEIVLPQRDQLVSKIVTNYLKDTKRRMDKTIFFCVDEEHAERMRRCLINDNLDMVKKDDRYVMRITSSDEIGKKQIDNFLNPRKKYPTLVTTSKLLSTGVNSVCCKLIVIDTNINSMVDFKQIIGRGTRISEEFDKTTFTIIDFTGATNLFADPNFDGEREVRKVVIKKNNTDKQNYKINVLDNEVRQVKKRMKKVKVILPNEEVKEIYSQEKLLDLDGNIIEESFNKYVQKVILENYPTFEDFQTYFQKDELKTKVIEQLEKKNIYEGILNDQYNEEYDIYDLISNIVYNKKMLTKNMRAKKVKKSDIWLKYDANVLEIRDFLLEQYIDYGLKVILDLNVLKVPFLMDKYGTINEIMTNVFRGIENYQQFLKEIIIKLYEDVK